jgi:excisionase family DNA binding protein
MKGGEIVGEACRKKQSDIRLSDMYVSIGQAATMLSVNRLTIRRWIDSGRLRGEAIGKVTLIAKQDVLTIARRRGVEV